jgi:hypothetical protein
VKAQSSRRHGRCHKRDNGSSADATAAFLSQTSVRDLIVDHAHTTAAHRTPTPRLGVRRELRHTAACRGRADLPMSGREGEHANVTRRAMLGLHVGSKGEC